MNNLKINDIVKEIKLITNEPGDNKICNDISLKTKKIKGCKEQWFVKGTRLAKEYIVVRSGYSAGPWESRAIGFNTETKKLDYAT